jgi:hypothetical protein
MQIEETADIVDRQGGIRAELCTTARGACDVAVCIDEGMRRGRGRL